MVQYNQMKTKKEVPLLKILKPMAILLALCLVFSGCSFFKKPLKEEENLISGEGNLSVNVEITPEIPESSESSSSEPEEEKEVSVSIGGRDF